MPLPPPSFHALEAVAQRWAVRPFDIVGWSAERWIALSILLPPVRIEPGETFSGLVDIEAAHVVALFREAAVAVPTVRIPSIRTRAGLRNIEEPADGLAIAAADVLVRHSEIALFERRHGVKLSRRSRGPGAPPRYDWDSFYGALARRIHDRGIPPTQSELVRDMLDWFDRKSEGPSPDERTVKRKVAAIWRELSQLSYDDEGRRAATG